MIDLTTVQDKMKAIAQAQTEYAKSAFEANKAYMEQLVAVKAPEEAMQLMVGHTKSSYETFVSEATKIGEMYKELFSSTLGAVHDVPTLRVVREMSENK